MKKQPQGLRNVPNNLRDTTGILKRACVTYLNLKIRIDAKFWQKTSFESVD